MTTIDTTELRRLTTLMLKARRLLRAENARRRAGRKGWNLGYILDRAAKVKAKLKVEVRRVREAVYPDGDSARREQ